MKKTIFALIFQFFSLFSISNAAFFTDPFQWQADKLANSFPSFRASDKVINSQATLNSTKNKDEEKILEAKHYYYGKEEVHRFVERYWKEREETSNEIAKITKSDEIKFEKISVISSCSIGYQKRNDGSYIADSKCTALIAGTELILLFALANLGAYKFISKKYLGFIIDQIKSGKLDSQIEKDEILKSLKAELSRSENDEPKEKAILEIAKLLSSNKNIFTKLADLIRRK
jgi:hypothetical protein